MSRQINTPHFDVLGCGHVSEQHAGERHPYLANVESGAVGGALAWLAFYAIAVVIVVVTNLQAVPGIVMAAAN